MVEQRNSDVLYEPKLSYNLLSVSKISDAGKIRFGEGSCQILDENKKLITVATRVGDLYYLNCRPGFQKSHSAVDKRKKQRKMSGIDILAILAILD